MNTSTTSAVELLEARGYVVTAPEVRHFEYAVRVTTPGNAVGLFYEYPDALSCDRFIKNAPLWYVPRPNETKVIVRRVKAGPWTEVAS